MFTGIFCALSSCRWNITSRNERDLFFSFAQSNPFMSFFVKWNVWKGSRRWKRASTAFRSRRIFSVCLFITSAGVNTLRTWRRRQAEAAKGRRMPCIKFNDVVGAATRSAIYACKSPARLSNVSSDVRLLTQYLRDHNVGSFINTRPTLFHKPLNINFSESSYDVRPTDRLSLELQFLLKTASLCLSLYLISISPLQPDPEPRSRDNSERRKHFWSQ